MREEIMEIEHIPAQPVIQTPTADSFRAALLIADDMRAKLVEEGDWVQLCYAVEGLKAIKRDLDTLLRECEADVADLLPDKKVTVPGFGVVEKRVASTRKWDSETLLMDICRRILDPEGTGEISVSSVVDLIAVLKKVMPITGSLGWRVTALKDAGIDPDNYSDISWGRKSIQITN
jgi:hypothetical protein